MRGAGPAIPERAGAHPLQPVATCSLWLCGAGHARDPQRARQRAHHM